MENSYRMSEQQRLQNIDKFREFQKKAKEARLQASTYIDLQEGDSTMVEVLIEKGVSTQEFKGQKGDYTKVKYIVLDLTIGKELDLYLTSKQSADADEKIEKLILLGLKPILKLKKVDNKTLDIEAIKEQKPPQ